MDRRVSEPRTIPDLFRWRVERSGPALAYRNFDAERGGWTDRTWNSVAAQVARWRQALAKEGFSAGDRVAIQLRNGLDWVCFDQAALSLGLVVVPLFVADAPSTSSFIIEDSGARLLVVGSLEDWIKLRAQGNGCSTLTRVVCLGPIDESAATDQRILRLDQWLPETADRSDRLELPPGPQDGPQPEGLATLVYTSGTTGRPKGVMLSHRNLLSVARAVLERNPGTDADVFLSYLPLAHIFERVVGYYVPLMIGASVVFARSIEQLRDDLLIARPTILMLVPSVLDRIHAAVRTQTEGHRVRRAMLAWTTAVGLAQYEAARDKRGRSPLRTLLWLILRRLVAQSILSRLGGRVRLAVSGGAPLSPESARFFLGLGLPLVEGYGLTEASSAVCAARLGAYVPGSAGWALHGVDIRIGEQDEIEVRSPGVMLGYWGRPADTASALRDGWLRTGDIGEIRDRQVFIRGRLKELIVLSSGEKLVPADLEAAIQRDPLFEQVMIVGKAQKRLLALAVLDRKAWPGLAGKLGLDPAEPRALAAPALQAAVLGRIHHQLRDFPRYARVRAACLLLAPWTVEDGLLTPTLKLKRTAIEERFADQLRQL